MKIELEVNADDIELNYSELASEINYRDLSQEIDHYDLAQEINHVDVADHLNYSQLAEEIRYSDIVSVLVNNEKAIEKIAEKVGSILIARAIESENKVAQVKDQLSILLEALK